MKSRRHRHKESFSVLLISNTGQRTRHFHVKRSFLRLVTALVLCVVVSFGWLMYHYVTEPGSAGVYVSAGAGTQETELVAQAAAQQEELAAKDAQIQQMESEIDSLNRRNSELTTENKALLAAARTTSDTGGAADMADTAEDSDSPAYPSRYPYSETGEVTQKYTDSHPYVSINTHGQGNILAAGDGEVVSVISDDSYPLMIEIDHGNGYRTRYMLPQEAETRLAEGAQVGRGDVLVELGDANVQLDYQVIRQDQPIDPLIVFEAKG